MNSQEKTLPNFFLAICLLKFSVVTRVRVRQYNKNTFRTEKDMSVHITFTR